MPKNQSTAAQSARRASQNGNKHTEALRRATTGDVPHAPHVLRFLAERSGNLYHLAGGIAAAWAHSGQRVLLLEEAEDYWRDAPAFETVMARIRVPRIGPGRPRTRPAMVLASRAYSSRAIRGHCVAQIRAVIRNRRTRSPTVCVGAAKAAARPASTRIPTSSASPSSGASTASSSDAAWPHEPTNSPSPTRPHSTSPPSSSGHGTDQGDS